jgi:hypothetical protein
MKKGEKEQFKEFGYYITSDTKFQNDRYNIPPSLASQLEALAIAARDNKKDRTQLERLTQLILEYPSVPMLKNYLSVAYNNIGMHEKAIEVNNWILKEHPDYLFARINLANKYIEDNESEKVPEILGEALELKSLYPEREVFHIGEFTSFTKIVIRYYVAEGNLALAENRLELLQDIAPDHPDTEDAEFYVYPLRLKLAADRYIKEKKNAIIPKIAKSIPHASGKNPPIFIHHQITEYLYKFGHNLPHKYIHELLELPEADLISDLEKVISDAVNRYSVFKKSGWEENTCSFVLHALLLLKEKKASKSLPNVLEFLEYNNSFLDFWLGDHITETLWQCIYTLGFDQTGLLQQFLLKPGLDRYSKNAVSVALSQMALHNSQKRHEILTIYSEVFSRFDSSVPKDNLIDSEFLGLAIGDAMDCNFHELLPVIRSLYAKKFVAEGINGSIETVEKEFRMPLLRNFIRDINSIFKIYDDVLITWTQEEDEIYKEEERPVIQLKPLTKKVGRNDLCPCGSGKKYKNCCLNIKS